MQRSAVSGALRCLAAADAPAIGSLRHRLAARAAPRACAPPRAPARGPRCGGSQRLVHAPLGALPAAWARGFGAAADTGAAAAAQQPLQRSLIGIFGAMNAGKSVLMNLLTQAETSIVHATPGTTADPKAAVLELHGLGPVKLVDNPGLDERGPLGDLKREKAFAVMKTCDVVVVVVDPLAPPSASLETTALALERAFLTQEANRQAELPHAEPAGAVGWRARARTGAHPEVLLVYNVFKDAWKASGKDVNVHLDAFEAGLRRQLAAALKRKEAEIKLPRALALDCRAADAFPRMVHPRCRRRTCALTAHRRTAQVAFLETNVSRRQSPVALLPMLGLRPNVRAPRVRARPRRTRMRRIRCSSTYPWTRRPPGGACCGRKRSHKRPCCEAS